MKSYWMEGREGQLHIAMREVDMPQVGAGQLLVKIHAAGLNRGEFIVGPGPHGGLPHAKPIWMEAAGEVVAIGAGVIGFAVGQRVMGRCPGAFSEYALMDVRETIAVPDGVSWEEAAAIPLTFLVVHDMLFAQGGLEPGVIAALEKIGPAIFIGHSAGGTLGGRIATHVADELGVGVHLWGPIRGRTGGRSSDR